MPNNNNNERINEILTRLNNREVIRLPGTSNNNNMNEIRVNNQPINNLAENQQQQRVNPVGSSAIQDLVELSNQAGQLSAGMSESVQIIRQNNIDNDRSLEIIRNNNNQLALRLNDNHSLTFNSITRSIIGTGIIGVCSYFGFRIMNSWLTNYINASHITQHEVVFRYTFDFGGKTYSFFKEQIVK